MRIISNAKAREGKGTWYRKLLAEHARFVRSIGDPLILWRGSKCKMGVTMLGFCQGIEFWMFEVAYDLQERKADHISINQLKKGCKRKREQVEILLY